MLLSPVAERHDAGFVDKGDDFPLSLSRNSCPLLVIKRVPEALGPAVEDQENVFVDIAADAEAVDLALVPASVNYGQFSQRSPAHPDSLGAERVVHEFVMIK